MNVGGHKPSVKAGVQPPAHGLHAAQDGHAGGPIQNRKLT